MASSYGTNCICVNFGGPGGEISLFRDEDTPVGFVGVRVLGDGIAGEMSMDVALARQVIAHLLALIDSIDEEGV